MKVTPYWSYSSPYLLPSPGYSVASTTTGVAVCGKRPDFHQSIITGYNHHNFIVKVRLLNVFSRRANRQRPLLLHDVLFGLFRCCWRFASVFGRADGCDCRWLALLAEMRRVHEHHHRFAFHARWSMRCAVFHAQKRSTFPFRLTNIFMAIKALDFSEQQDQPVPLEKEEPCSPTFPVFIELK